jgi:hypothetical protein
MLEEAQIHARRGICILRHCFLKTKELFCRTFYTPLCKSCVHFCCAYTLPGMLHFAWHAVNDKVAAKRPLNNTLNNLQTICVKEGRDDTSHTINKYGSPMSSNINIYSVFSNVPSMLFRYHESLQADILKVEIENWPGASGRNP